MAIITCCLFENLMLGKLLNIFTDLPRVAYKMVAYKKNTCTYNFVKLHTYKFVKIPVQ